MTPLAKIGSASRTRTSPGRTRRRSCRSSSSSSSTGRLLPAELLREHARHPPRVPHRGRACSSFGSCSPRRSRPPRGSTRATSTSRTSRSAPARRSTSTPRSTSCRSGRSTGPQPAPLLGASTRSRGGSRRCQRLATLRFLDHDGEALSRCSPDHAVRGESRSRLDPRARTSSAWTCRHLGLPSRRVRVLDQLTGARYGWRTAATTSASTPRRGGPRLL